MTENELLPLWKQVMDKVQMFLKFFETSLVYTIKKHSLAFFVIRNNIVDSQYSASLDG
jgi:hypothetical protein